MPVDPINSVGVTKITENNLVKVSSQVAKSNPKSNPKLIQEFALISLKEGAIGLAMIGVSSYFTATSAIPLFLAPLVLHVFICAASTFISFSLKKIKEIDSEIKYIDYAEKLREILSALSFSLIDLTTTSTLFHEMGHAFAACSVYEHPNVHLELLPLEGGITRTSFRNLSALGKNFGANNSQLLLSAAGPMAGVCYATVCMGLAHYLKKEYPKLATYLNVMAIITIAMHVIYALSPLWEVSPKAGHDFAALWKLGGIHPIVSAIGVIALPLLVKVGLYAFSKTEKEAKN